MNSGSLITSSARVGTGTGNGPGATGFSRQALLAGTGGRSLLGSVGPISFTTGSTKFTGSRTAITLSATPLDLLCLLSTGSPESST